MEEKQAKAIKRVVKKLNALRATLSRSERAILDALIVREPEVKGHAMLTGAMTASAHLGDAATSDAATSGAATGGAATSDAATSDAAVAEAAVAEAVIGLASTGYVVEIG